jgi:hypothetical protein
MVSHEAEAVIAAVVIQAEYVPELMCQDVGVALQTSFVVSHENVRMTNVTEAINSARIGPRRESHGEALPFNRNRFLDRVQERVDRLGIVGRCPLGEARYPQVKAGGAEVGRSGGNYARSVLLGIGSEGVKPLFVYGEGDVQDVGPGIFSPPGRRDKWLACMPVPFEGRHERAADDDKG